jgi:hypothetical protein
MTSNADTLHTSRTRGVCLPDFGVVAVLAVLRDVTL